MPHVCDVVLVLWPDQAAELSRLATAGVPRLLLVAPDALAPRDGDCLQDWIRLPADDQDVRARIAGLARRSSSHRGPPTVNDEGQLTYRGQSTWLSSKERLLFDALADRFGATVPLEVLVEQAWPEGPPASNPIRVHILKLRRRIAPLGLEIRHVQGRGYALTNGG